MNQIELEAHHTRFTTEVILFPPVITNVCAMNYGTQNKYSHTIAEGF